jgi:MATE family multidrug resistance protein
MKCSLEWKDTRNRKKKGWTYIPSNCSLPLGGFMQLRTSYKQILAIAAPIMLGSAAQNVIALSDSVFLYHRSEVDFASIGFVSVFYLIIAAIGFGFSRGGQIIIARRVGEQTYDRVRRAFYSMFYFELGLAILMFLFMQYGCYYFFQLIVDSPVVFSKSLEYLEYRSWGVFFSYSGVVLVAFYTGIARTTFIIVDTLILAAVNIILNYALIFGAWGFPEMGIAGAGLASTIAEVVAMVVFVVYMIFDRSIRPFKLIKLPRFEWQPIKTLYRISIPMVVQAIVGLGSWFAFFGIVENMGERQLAITNLVRMVYLILSIPSWGFSSGVNTMVSNFIGARKRQAVFPIVWKTAKICWISTMVISLPVVLFPETVLYPLLGSSDMSLITDARPIFYVLLGILTLFSFGGVFFNGLVGTGATYLGLKVQVLGVVFYIAYIYLVVEILEAGLGWAWASEIFYWLYILAISGWYLASSKWHKVVF